MEDARATLRGGKRRRREDPHDREGREPPPDHVRRAERAAIHEHEDERGRRRAPEHGGSGRLFAPQKHEAGENEGDSQDDQAVAEPHRRIDGEDRDGQIGDGGHGDRVPLRHSPGVVRSR